MSPKARVDDGGSNEGCAPVSRLLFVLLSVAVTYSHMVPGQDAAQLREVIMSSSIPSLKKHPVLPERKECPVSAALLDTGPRPRPAVIATAMSQPASIEFTSRMGRGHVCAGLCLMLICISLSGIICTDFILIRMDYSRTVSSLTSHGTLK